MSNIKTSVQTIYTYETTDGATFDSLEEAKVWQKMIDNVSTISMYDSYFRPTKHVDSCFYIHLETHEQVEAFLIKCRAEYLPVRGIKGIGHYYYDEQDDEYVLIEDKISHLQGIIQEMANRPVDQITINEFLMENKDV